MHKKFIRQALGFCFLCYTLAALVCLGEKQQTKDFEPGTTSPLLFSAGASAQRPGKRRSLRAGEIRAVKVAGRPRSNRWRVNISGGKREETEFLTWPSKA